MRVLYEHMVCRSKARSCTPSPRQKTGDNREDDGDQLTIQSPKIQRKKQNEDEKKKIDKILIIRWIPSESN